MLVYRPSSLISKSLAFCEIMCTMQLVNYNKITKKKAVTNKFSKQKINLHSTKKLGLPFFFFVLLFQFMSIFYPVGLFSLKILEILQNCTFKATMHFLAEHAHRPLPPFLNAVAFVISTSIVNCPHNASSHLPHQLLRTPGQKYIRDM